MKKKTAFILVAVAVLAIGAGTAALAASPYDTPAEIVAALTGKTAEQAVSDRESGIPYGQQAAQAGQLDAFKEQRLALCKDKLDEAVAAGTLTQAEADALYARMQEKMQNCDGDGSGACGGNGAGYRSGACGGNGAGFRSGACGGNGAGMRGRGGCCGG